MDQYERAKTASDVLQTCMLSDYVPGVELLCDVIRDEQLWTHLCADDGSRFESFADYIDCMNEEHDEIRSRSGGRITANAACRIEHERGQAKLAAAMARLDAE